MMKNTFRYTVSTCLLLFLVVGVHAEGSPREPSSFEARFLVQFPINRSDIDPEYKDNYYAIQELRRFFSTVDLSMVDSVLIVGSASPDGSASSNRQLARVRAESLRSFIEARFSLDPRKLYLQSRGDTWPEMLSLIRRDETFPSKTDALVVLSNEIPYADRLKVLRFMGYRAAYESLKRDIFPCLRHTTAVAIYYKDAKPFDVYDNQKDYTRHKFVIASTEESSEFFHSKSVPSVRSDSAEVAILSTLRSVPLEVRQPILALKTNLLFDAGSLLNLELEVPLGKRFSLAGEVIAPWWLWRDQQHCLQVLSGNLEGRYWFGNRDQTRRGTRRSVMTGWFAGFYVGGGYYDLEWDRRGYQGEFFIAAGLSGGYAHTLNKRGNLRMEYSLGLGYMQTHYREYEARMGADDQWHLYRQNDGKFSWFGPTRAKISLVWMLHRPVKPSKGIR